MQRFRRKDDLGQFPQGQPRKMVNSKTYIGFAGSALLRDVKAPPGDLCRDPVVAGARLIKTHTESTLLKLISDIRPAGVRLSRYTTDHSRPSERPIR